MKLTEIAARLRMASAEMSVLAALTGDTDLPLDMVPPFILNFIGDEHMFPTMLRAGARSLRRENREG